jgi:hypothetical protein
MITETGNDLCVLIITEPGMDWETYATWYSIHNNLPDADISITSVRNNKPMFQLYQWAKRVDIPVIHHKPFSEDPVLRKLDSIHRAKKTKENLLVVNPLVMTTETLCPKITESFNTEDRIFDDNVWFLKKPDIPDMMNEYALEGGLFKASTTICFEANETNEPKCLVSYKKGCGKWIDTLRGCPFSNAAGLALTTMTVNENRVIELWKKMCSLYSAIS